jgi:hypothetical protein
MSDPERAGRLSGGPRRPFPLPDISFSVPGHCPYNADNFMPAGRPGGGEMRLAAPPAAPSSEPQTTGKTYGPDSSFFHR